MITIFATPKPFKGHEAIIQRNAIKSWKLLHSDIEIILFGNEEGAAEAARELNIRHEPQVLTNEYGRPFLNDVFGRAQRMAKYDIVAYVNCDIILMSDFIRAVKEVSAWREKFLMVGSRRDIDIKEALNFERTGWEKDLKYLALHYGKLQGPSCADYYLFSKGLYKSIPPFIMGRASWEGWLIRKVRSLKIPVVNASNVILVVHQRHKYLYNLADKQGSVYRELAYNRKIEDGWGYGWTLEDSSYILTNDGIRRNPYLLLARIKQCGWWLWWLFILPAWFILLGTTRPVRHFMGLRQETTNRFLRKADREECR